MKLNQFLATVCLLAFVAVFVDGNAVYSQQFEISWYSIDAGGGSGANGNFELIGTIGQHDAAVSMTAGSFEVTGGFWADTIQDAIILGDVNGDGVVNLLDVGPFIDAVSDGTYIPEADVNQDGFVNLLDVDAFVELLGGG